RTAGSALLSKTAAPGCRRPRCPDCSRSSSGILTAEARASGSTSVGSRSSSGAVASATSRGPGAGRNSGFVYAVPWRDTINRQGISVMAKLLLLDDEPVTLEWMAAALTSVGHEVRAYRSGRDALAALTEWRPDLIVADILMPELDGVAFARLVRAHGGPPA